MPEVFVLELQDDSGTEHLIGVADSLETAGRWLFQRYNIPPEKAKKQISNPDRVAWIGKDVTAALKHVHCYGDWNVVTCTRYEVVVAAEVATDNFAHIGSAELTDCEAT